MPRIRGCSGKIFKDAFSSSLSSFPFVQVLWCHFKEALIFSKTLSLRTLRLCVNESPGQGDFESVLIHAIHGKKYACIMQGWWYCGGSGPEPALSEMLNV